MPSRDLKVSIDGDARGFDDACTKAEEKARGLDRELAQLERQQAAQERVTTRTTAAVKTFATAQDRAALSARKMGLEVEAAADRAAKAQVRAAAAAAAYEKGLISEEKAARAAALADSATERAAIKAAEAQVVAAEAADKRAKAEKKLADDAKKQQQADVKGMQGGLVSLGAAAGALAVPVGVAGLAFAGFAAVAAPSIAKVVKAQADLGANWSTLDKGQRVAATNVAALADQYKLLAKSYEPDALRSFNGLVSTARTLMPELGKTVQSTKGGFADFSTSVENSLGREVPRLFGVVRSQGTPALHELGTTFSETAGLAVNLVQGLAPLGMTVLHSANGVLTLLNALTAIDPRLTEFAGAAFALRAPLSAVNSVIEKTQGVFGAVGGATAGAAGKLAGAADEAGSAAEKLGEVAKSSRLATGATKALNAVTALGPNLYLAAGAAMAYLAIRTITARNSTDAMIQAVREQNDATGNNIAGHRAAVQALGELSIGTVKYSQYISASRKEMQKMIAGVDTQKLMQVSKAYGAELEAVQKGTAGEKLLAQQYGITTTQAEQLATAAGVDLTKGITGSSAAAIAARTKIADYKAAVAAAADPTARIADDMTKAANTGLLMKDRIASVTDALSAYFTPASQAWDATTNLEQGWRNLSKAMKAAKGNFSGNTDASTALRQALTQQLDSVGALYQANLQTKGYTAAHAAAEQQIQVMYALVGKSKAARGQVDALAQSLGLTVGRSNLSKAAFMAAAAAMHIAKGRAEELWRAYQRLPAAKTTTFRDNASTARDRIQALQASITNLHGKTVTIDYIERVHRTTQAERGSARGDAAGGYVGYAHGGQVKRLADGGPSGPVVGPGSGTSDDIPVFLSNGEYVIRATQTKKHRRLLDAINKGTDGFASGGVVGYATGGSVTPLSLSDVLQHWQDVRSPASKADVSKAVKARRSEVNKLKSAEDALYRARKRHDPRAIAAAERRIAAARQDLAAATSKLSDVEARYKFAKLSPVAQLDAALGLGIKDNAAFIKNLQTLADRGFGDLANKLLSMGGPQAEKIAASAVKLSTTKLTGLQGKITQEQQQQDYMANLPAILNIRSAIKNTKGGISTWAALLDATGLDGGSLAAAVKLMSADLSKTASGKALLADMHAHGYARGGVITGPAGVDRVPMWGTAGEYVVNAQAAAQHRPLLDAINYSATRVSASPVQARGGDGAAAGACVHQTFETQAMDVHQLARESARQAAWMLRG